MKNIKLVRKNFFISENHVEALRLESEARGLSAAEILRRILDKHYKKR